MPRPRTALLAAVPLLLLVGCGDDDTAVDTATTSSSTTIASTTSTPESSTIPTSTVVATTAAPPVETGVVLAVDGLTVVPFGASADNALSALSDALGAPTSDDAVECPSGADRSVRFGNLLTTFSGGFLVGYTYGGPAPAGATEHTLATVEGLALGADEAALRALYPDVTIEETSLGTEFTVEAPRGSLGGLLSGPGGGVEVIFAGDPCAFR